MKLILHFVLIMYSYFAFSEVCVNLDGKVNGYDNKYYFLKLDEKTTIRVKKNRLAKNLSRFLLMNKYNRVQECFPADSIEKPKK